MTSKHQSVSVSDVSIILVSYRSVEQWKTGPSRPDDTSRLCSSKMINESRALFKRTILTLHSIFLSVLELLLEGVVR